MCLIHDLKKKIVFFFNLLVINYYTLFSVISITCKPSRQTVLCLLNFHSIFSVKIKGGWVSYFTENEKAFEINYAFIIQSDAAQYFLVLFYVYFVETKLNIYLWLILVWWFSVWRMCVGIVCCFLLVLILDSKYTVPRTAFVIYICSFNLSVTKNLINDI